MTRIHLRRFVRGVAALAISLLSALVLAGPPGYLDLRRIERLHGDAAAGNAKAAACRGCHGAAGVSPVPAFPNLAGQHAEYLYWRLVEFKHEARPESPMTAQVAQLDDAAMRDLAMYFSSLPTTSVATTDSSESKDRGRALYREGDPAKGVPPCQGCHGVAGGGHPLANASARWRAYPVLRGQHADYLVQRLMGFRGREHGTSTNAFVMQGVAQNLDETAMRDIAAWLQTQP
jgi:cytochrome c553